MAKDTDNNDKYSPSECIMCKGNELQVGPMTHRTQTGGPALCLKCLKIGLEAFDNNPEVKQRAELAWARFAEVSMREQAEKKDLPLPKRIYDRLSERVIGQDFAKEVLAIACVEHLKGILSRACHHPVPLDKRNILMIGPTGVGKTELARVLADFLEVPFAIGDATTLTAAGYVGEDIENLLLKLLQVAGGDIEAAERGVIYIDEIDKLVKKNGNVSITRDVGGEAVQQGLLKIIEGTVANVPTHAGRKHPEEQYIQIDTTNILFICGGTFYSGGGSGRIEEIVARRQDESTIGFSANVRAEKPEKHYDELRGLIEPDDLVDFGMIPEFVGRMPIIAPLHTLDLDHLVRILHEPSRAITKQIKQSFAISDVELEFEPAALEEIAKKALDLNTGARGLGTVMAKLMHKPQFNIDQYADKRIVITPNIVRGDDEIMPLDRKDAA